jgi:hypothetical protein
MRWWFSHLWLSGVQLSMRHSRKTPTQCRQHQVVVVVVVLQIM